MKSEERMKATIKLKIQVFETIFALASTWLQYLTLGFTHLSFYECHILTLLVESFDNKVRLSITNRVNINRTRHSCKK